MLKRIFTFVFLSFMMIFCINDNLVLDFDGEIEDVIFSKEKKRICVCLKKNNENRTFFIYDDEFEIKNKFDLNGNIKLLNNSGFNNYIAYKLIGPKNNTGYQRIELKFYNIDTKQKIPSKLYIKEGLDGKWLDKKRDKYLIKGNLCIIKDNMVEKQKVSSVYNTEVGPDLEWSISALVEKLTDGYKINIDMGNLKNNNMINVESYRCDTFKVDMFEFAKDPRYVYYRSKNNPALYDIEKFYALQIDNIKFDKLQQYFGYYLKGKDYYYFYNYYSIVVVDKDGFEIKKIIGNPFNPGIVSILNTDKYDIFGVVYNIKEQKKDFVKLFVYNWKKADYKEQPLPLNVKKVWYDDEDAMYLYTKEDKLYFVKTKMEL